MTSDPVFEITCNSCRASVAADVEICPSCGAVLIAHDAFAEISKRPFGAFDATPSNAAAVHE